MEDWNISTPIQVSVSVQGFDAATLNGLPGSFYLNAGNLTGTIDPARIAGLDWSKITTGKPTTLAGYGISDAYSKTETDTSLSNKQNISNELTALSNLIDTPGLIRKTGNGTYTIDANSYLTSNQTITLSGDATGSGTTAINVTLPNIVTAGSSAKPTYNAKGLITASGTLLASDIPNLDAGKITSGTFSDARLAGSYTGLTSITGSGNCTFDAFYVANTASWDALAGKITCNPRLLIVGIPDRDGGSRMLEFSGAILSTVRIAAATTPKGIYLSNLTNGVTADRWQITSDAASNETGSNAGSDLLIGCWDDAGGWLGSALSIKRSTRDVTIGSSTSSTSTTTGALRVSGGIGANHIFANLFNGHHQLKTYTTATEPVASASTVGQIWLNTSLGKVRVVVNATTIQTITST